MRYNTVVEATSNDPNSMIQKRLSRQACHRYFASDGEVLLFFGVLIACLAERCCSFRLYLEDIKVCRQVSKPYQQFDHDDL